MDAAAGEIKTRNRLSRHCRGTQAWKRDENMNFVAASASKIRHPV
jgi:hypothetical protein